MGLGLWFVCRCVGERVLCGLLLVCVGARVFLCVCVCVFLFSLCLLPSLWLFSLWVCSSVSVLLCFLVRFLVF